VEEKITMISEVTASEKLKVQSWRKKFQCNFGKRFK